MKKKLLMMMLLVAVFGMTENVFAQCTAGGPVTTASAVSVCDGTTTANVPVTVSSFSNVGAISLKLIYDASKLGVADSLSKNVLMTWPNFKINTSTSGVIIVSGFGAGITIPDNQALFTIRFTKGTPLTTGSLSFSENILGTSCEYAPDAPPDYTPFCDTPMDTYYIAGGVTVDPIPVSPTLSSSTPAETSIVCAGYNTGFASFTGGSGGGVNEYQYSIDGGSTWSTYTNNASITTTGASTSVKVRARRSGGSCAASSYNTYTIWTIASTPTAPALSEASPADGTTVCADYNAGTVTGAAGSGGATGAVDEYQVSINGGSSYSAYTNGAAINTTGATGSIIVQSRRTAGLYGCSNSAWSTICTWTVASTPTAPVLSAASPPDGTTVCADYNAGTVTGAAGSGGATGAVDEYQFSINNGSTWTTYTNGSAITTTGATGSIIVQSRRTAGIFGCSPSDWSTICTWTVASTPTAPVLSAASPADGTTVCAGYNAGTVTGAAGSGGATGAVDEYQFSINNGSTWTTYTNGSAITTTGATESIIVQSRRTAGNYGCSPSDWNTICTWTVASTPTAPALSVASPVNGTGICAGTNAAGTVTGAAGSGGSTGAMDEYQYSIDGGSTWSAYTNGAVINTTTATLSVIVQSRRTAGNYGCSDSEWNTICTWIINVRKTISGTFSYYNLTGNIPMTEGNITVQLYKSSDAAHETLLATDVTDGSGNYEFPDLCPDCSYDIVATSTHVTDFAVNTTDAAQVNYFGVNPYSIEKVRFHAGDVGRSGVPSNLTINATDAGWIQNNFVYGTPFDNTWTFWEAGESISVTATTESYPSVNLAIGSNFVANMLGLVTGDFNRSFNPSTVKAASSTLDLIYTGNRQAGTGQEFELPVQLLNASTVGAASLILDIPADLVEVQDVMINGAGGQLDWAVKGNELRIGWNSPVPLYLGASSDFLTLKLKTTSAFTSGNSIRISLATNPLNELADDQYNVIGNAVLGVMVVDASSLGINEDPAAAAISMNAYPNPFSNFTTISYSLPFEGRVTVEISNIMGSRVNSLIDEVQAAGGHSLKFATAGLPSGVYFAKLRLKSGNDELIRTIRLINNM